MNNTSNIPEHLSYSYSEIGLNVEVLTVDIGNEPISTIRVDGSSVRVILNDIRDFDFDHGFIPFTMNGNKRCLIGVRGEYRNIILFINIDDKIYEEYFVNTEQIKVTSVANGLNSKNPIIKAKINLFISKDCSTDIEITFFYSSDGIHNLSWTDPVMYSTHGDKLKILKIDRKLLVPCGNKLYANKGKKASGNEKDINSIALIRSSHDILDGICERAIYGVAEFSQFTRGERLILAGHLNAVTDMIDKKLKEITASAEK